MHEFTWFQFLGFHELICGLLCWFLLTYMLQTVLSIKVINKGQQLKFFQESFCAHSTPEENYAEDEKEVCTYPLIF
jgi:hypothetical protein